MTKVHITTFMLISILLWSFLALSSYAYSPSPYSIKDLEILEKQKSYMEFFDHALDLKPVERNNHWRELVYNSSENFLKELILTQRYAKDTLKYVEKISLWPTLRNNEIFQIKRAEFGLKYFEFCLENAKKANILQKGECTTQMQMFWKNTPKDYINLKLGRDLAALTNSYLPSEDPWFYHSNILSNKYSSDICDNTELAQSFLTKVRTDPYFSSKQTNLKTVISRYISNSCKKYLVPHIKLILSKTQSSKNMEIYVSILKAMDSLKKGELDFYLTTYVLRGPENGPIFNMAWNTIYELGKSFKRREATLNQLKKMGSLPGNLFKISDLNRFKIIMVFLSKHFPEYIDYYAATCIKYLKGEIRTNAGNPTPGCHDLFRRSKNSNWISKNLHQKYLESL